jgi:hypothetical protein
VPVIADDPRTHTTKFVYAKDLYLDADSKATLGQVITDLYAYNEQLKKENETLKEAIKKIVASISVINNK